MSENMAWPPTDAPEMEMLSGFLDGYRDAIVRKIEGASDEDLRKRLVPSETTLLGIVKHLAYVERGWFQRTFAGIEGLEFPWSDEDPDADFKLGPDDTTERVVAFYKEECDKSREAVAGASPDDRAHREGRSDYTLRWIMLHMIEETARHAGHADILREQLDGTTGE